MLAAAFFMPWITISASSFLASVSFSYSMVDFFTQLIARTPLIQALQPTFGTMYNPSAGTQNLPLDTGLVAGLWLATILAAVLYIIALVYAAIFFIRSSSLYTLSSAVLAIASFVSTFFAAYLIRQQVFEWGQMGSTETILFNMKLDIGAWVALVAGFLFVGSWFLARQTTSAVRSDEVEKGKVDRSEMFCRECGRKIPRDSKFCKECGAKLM